MAQMTARDKYRVQTRYANPPEVAAHSGKTHKWVDVSAHHTLSDAKRVVLPHQRIIKLCTPSEGALRMDAQGRRFNIFVSPSEEGATA